MRRNRGNGKDIYRKKPYTPEFKKNLSGEYKKFIEELKNIPKEHPIHLFNFIADKFGLFEGLKERDSNSRLVEEEQFNSLKGEKEKNSDLKVIIFCQNEELRKMLIDIGDKGANLEVINRALQIPTIDEYLLDGHPIGLDFREGKLSPIWNQEIEKYNQKRKAFGKRERIIKVHIKSICTLETMPDSLVQFVNELPLINYKLLAVQEALKEFEEVIDKYFEAKAIRDGLIGYPARWGLSIEKLLRKEFKPVTQRTHGVLNARILILVDELKRIGFSDEQAYIKTAVLLSLTFPHLIKKVDADRVRQKYTYHKKLR